MSSSFGQLFRIHTWGESHGGGVGVVIDGCPPRVPLEVEEIQAELDRRRPGQSHLTTPRQEEDCAQILSGVFEGQTLGTPILIWVQNKDARPSAYDQLKDVYRPSHADFTYEAKYGIRNWQGGGRASARETVGRVAAGAIARKILRLAGFGEIVGFVSQVHSVECKLDAMQVTREMVEASITRCPDTEAADEIVRRIDDARGRGDSLGGIVTCVVHDPLVGIGEPVFDKLEAELAKGLLSLPACKGFEIGSGFSGVKMTGIEHNDAFYEEDGRVRTRTNLSGGIQGGITNGEAIVLRAAFKPTATIRLEQETLTTDKKPTTLEASGRHDPCVLPRAVPMVESMVALVLCDQLMRQRAMRISDDFNDRSS